MPQTFMSRRAFIPICIVALFGLLPASSKAQSSPKPATGNIASAEQGLGLASQGRCREALPVLKKAEAQNPPKGVRYNLLMATARCAMSVERTEAAVQALLELNRDFAHDPEVLYITTHFYSELAARASQDLASTAPASAQAQQLEAEAFEAHADWDKAEAEYKRILEQNPQRRGIHYQLGRISLLKTPPDSANASQEFEEELKVDPRNASAEFMLGETARQAGKWDEAIARFAKAVEFDVGFDEAYLALGMSLNSAGKFSDAVVPLEAYVKRQPGDPAGHYQLGTAYARTGRKQQAEKEMELQREAAQKAPRGEP